ncbi:MAG TPA: glycosyltransferase family 2 protein [Solirubrobacterales bacterium]
MIVPTITPSLVVRLLDSLSAAGDAFETIVVDNGTGSAELDRVAAGLEGASVLRLDENLGYGRAVNRAARRAQGEALVLLNDDSVVDPGYVGRLAAALDPAAGVVMSAGVMRDAGAPELIETAGIELDRTLLAYDYLNGEPLASLDAEVADPIGPAGAAAALDREAFLAAGGFDERLFAYLEDVDLALRLRLDGGRCRLATDAKGTHAHSMTLGPGSARKDYLAGYGRGYLLRKWSVISPRRLPSVLIREVPQALIQSVVDRNLGPVRGRVNGLRAGVPPEAYPPPGVLGDPPSLAASAGRRWRRRARLRRRSD